MTRIARNLSLFDDIDDGAVHQESLASGAVLLRAFARQRDAALLTAVENIVVAAPLRHMVTPGGHRMSVAMTNCGELGWVSEARGYRYDAIDPHTGLHWPSMPVLLRQLAQEAAAAAGFDAFQPDACLVNRYVPGAKLSLHQDRNEPDLSQPIVSVSLGIPAMFLFAGLRRDDTPVKVPLFHGDVVVWGGASRLRYHGVAPLREEVHPLVGACRFNLTFRKAGPAAGGG